MQLVLGTAGHIDHGKSALTRALTGIDPDRLPEEKSRGITIELGFAPLDLAAGLRLAVVDVPGHEKLVRTMIAGATGIDLVLLVVAADEGVMPQTREHLAICDLLGLRRGVVALSKIDLVDEDVAELAREEVREALAATALGGAPVVAVSARTGTGLGELRDALAAAAHDAVAATPRSGPPRLWIDRAFAARGFGTVVTGTLVGAPLHTGDAVELLPGGLSARVRGLQRFGSASDEVAPGTRCAVNLQGVDLEQVSRGQLLAAPGAIALTRTFDARVRWLDEAAPLTDAPTSVELLTGTAERRARIAPIGAHGLASGGSGFARVHVDGEPIPLLPGDRFVLRGFARTATGGTTLGGGQVLDVAPPHRRRHDRTLAVELARLDRAGLAAALVLRVARAGYRGRATAALARECGVAQADVRSHLAGSDAVLACGADQWLATEAALELEQMLMAALERHQVDEPLRPGMPRGALRGALPANTSDAAFDPLLERLAVAKRVDLLSDLVCTAGFIPRLTQHQEAMAAHLRADAMASGLEPPDLRAWCQDLKAEEPEVRALLAYLERDGSLVRAPDDRWFDRGAVDELRERVLAHLNEHGELATQDYKDLIGTSRKWAVPLMELFDTEHLTVRRGDVRVLRRRPAAG